ncbi:MAG: DMT family transporter [candidate division Zixibacteria bacterium]|nr:DMT family transporter [Candidatus Tariuqbacter arcticus]
MPILPAYSNSSEEHSRPLGYYLCILSSLFTAGLIIIGKWVMVQGDPIFLGGLVLFIAGLILVGWVVLKQGFHWLRGISRTGWRYTIIYTVFSILAVSAFWQGIAMVDASKVGFLSRLQTIVIIFGGVVILHERFGAMEIFTGVMVLAGAVIIRGTMSMEMSAGFWVMIFSAFCFGLVELTAKLLVSYVEPYRFNAFRNLAAGIVMIAWGIVRGTAEWELGDIWWGIIAMACLGPLAGRTFYLYALRYAEVSKTSLVTQIQPVFVVILAVIFLQEYPCLRELIGGGLIILGSWGVIFFNPQVVSKIMRINTKKHQSY